MSGFLFPASEEKVLLLTVVDAPLGGADEGGRRFINQLVLRLLELAARGSHVLRLLVKVVRTADLVEVALISAELGHGRLLEQLGKLALGHFAFYFC